MQHRQVERAHRRQGGGGEQQQQRERRQPHPPRTRPRPPRPLMSVSGPPAEKEEDEGRRHACVRGSRWVSAKCVTRPLRLEADATLICLSRSDSLRFAVPPPTALWTTDRMGEARKTDASQARTHSRIYAVARSSADRAECIGRRRTPIGRREGVRRTDGASEAREEKGRRRRRRRVRGIDRVWSGPGGGGGGGESKRWRGAIEIGEGRKGGGVTSDSTFPFI